MELLVLILGLTNLLANSAYSSIAPFFPLEALRKGIAEGLIGFIFSIYSVSKVIASPLIAQMMGKTGRKPILLGGLLLEGVATVSFGLIESIDDALWFGLLSALCRLIMGLGNACLATASYALVASHYPAKVDRVVSTLQGFTGLGMTLGPVLGSGLYAWGGFTLPFYSTGVALLLFLIVVALALPKNTDRQTPASWRSPTSPSFQEGNLTVFTLLRYVKISIILSAVGLSILQLVMKEPILQVRVIQLGISEQLAGMFFAFEVVAFMATSIVLSCIDRKHKNLDLILLFSILGPIVGYFLGGPIHWLGVPESVIPLSIGMLFNGACGALAINTAVAAIIEYKKDKFWR